MIRFHLFTSLSPHLYMTTRHKLKYTAGKMKPSAADKKSGRRVYLNRMILMDENSGCVYLEYVREDRPESLYPFLYNAFAPKEPDNKLLSGMPDALILPKSLQSKEMISFLQAHNIAVKTPEPGFRSGSNVFRQITSIENNFEDDGLWIAPSTVWPVDLDYVNRRMSGWVGFIHNGLPRKGDEQRRFEKFHLNNPSLRFPENEDVFLSPLDAQTNKNVEALKAELQKHRPAKKKKQFTAEDWFKADEAFDTGMEYAWSGDPKKAMQMYRRALEIHPGHVDSHVHIGNNLSRMGRSSEAEDSYRRAVSLGREQLGEIEPGSAWLDLDTRPYMRALHGLGLTLEKRKDWEQALKFYQELLRIDPDDHIGIRFLIGRVYHELGDFQKAEECYENAGDWPDGAWSLVWLYLEQNDLSKAALAAVKALQANAYVPNVLLSMKFFSHNYISHCAMQSYEQAVAYCQDYYMFLRRRVSNWREFLSRFVSVSEIRKMLDTDRPPDLSEQEIEALANRVVEQMD